MSFNVGAKHVAQIATDIEAQARSQEVCTSSEDLNRLSEALERAFGELRELAKAA